MHGQGHAIAYDFIGFLVPHNVEFDTKINTLGQLEAKRWKKAIFAAAILKNIGSSLLNITPLNSLSPKM